MSILRKTVAALGFVCFFSVALLPVSMSICGPVTWRMLHHAKRNHPIADVLSHPVAARPQSGNLERDIIRDIIPEEDSVRSLFEHTGIARNPVGFEPDGPEIYASQEFVERAWVSSFAFHTVLIL
ncbi:MAG TPA: hypothetical protein VKH64_16260 [Candidatus Binatia bacterium]|nr:hypothetical protein [Candidatus Binatia bacterium]